MAANQDNVMDVRTACKLSATLGLVLSLALTAGCTVTHVPSGEPYYDEPEPHYGEPEPYYGEPEPRYREPKPEPRPARGRRSAKILNPYIGLEAFPGSRIVEHEFDGRDSETVFESGANLQRMYGHFHRQLSSQGWRRTELEIERDEIEATYVRRGIEFELELKDEGGGLYELEIDVD
jgi:hypothetical protein